MIIRVDIMIMSVATVSLCIPLYILLVISNVKSGLDGLCCEQVLNDARLDFVLYGMFVVGINKILGSIL